MILFQEDPAEVNYGDNTYEYEPEVDLILPRLLLCLSIEDLQAVVYDVFLEMRELSHDARLTIPSKRFAHGVGCRRCISYCIMISKQTGFATVCRNHPYALNPMQNMRAVSNCDGLRPPA